MSTFREEVMDALDRYYGKHDGDTPAHILVSQSHYDWLESEKKLETVVRDGNKMPQSGFMGMIAWGVETLEPDSEPIAVMVDDETFWSNMPQAKDFYNKKE